MSNVLQEFEQRLKTLIENPTPQPDYELWQRIRWKGCDRRSDEIKERQGRVAGFYFMSVGVAFQNGSDPGWYYCIESGLDHVSIHEDSILGQVTE